MSEIEKLRQRMADMQAAIRIMEGEKPATAEKIAREVNRALDAIDRGDFEEMTKPKTKDVEVEWWGVMRRDHTIDGVYACEANAKYHASGFGYTVVRLTGKATVPE